MPVDDSILLKTQESTLHANRIQQKKNHIKKQLNIYKLYNQNKDIQPHRYHKVKSLNCGDPNCAMCGNPRKFWGEITMQEKRFMQESEEDIDV